MKIAPRFNGKSALPFPISQFYDLFPHGYNPPSLPSYHPPPLIPFYLSASLLTTLLSAPFLFAKSSLPLWEVWVFCRIPTCYIFSLSLPLTNCRDSLPFPYFSHPLHFQLVPNFSQTLPSLPLHSTQLWPQIRPPRPNIFYLRPRIRPLGYQIRFSRPYSIDHAPLPISSLHTLTKGHRVPPTM